MSEAAVDQRRFVERNLNRNVAVQLAHGTFGQTGFRLFNAPTFLPAYLYAISGSELFVGLARSLQALGQVITPVVGASLIGHRKKVLGISLVAGALMRVQILFVALSGLFLGHSHVGAVAIVFFMAMMGIFQGMQGVMLNSLRAKVIPVRRRGFVTGWRNFLAGGTTAALSYFAGGYFIDNNVFGDGYATLFLVAFLITCIGLGALALTREPAAESVRGRENVAESFRALPALLRENPAFARFFLVGALGSFGRMAMPFYIIYAGTRMDLSGAMLGVLTTIWMLTGTASQLVWGRTADRFGYRVVMIATLSIWTVAHVELLMASEILGIMTFFMMIGTAVGGFNQARQNLVLELGAERDIPLRVAVSNMAVNAIGTVGPLLGGLIASVFNHAMIVELCIVMQALALVILIGWIPEPRRQGTADTQRPDLKR
ncbi:MAG: MFS transporter [Pseudomonadales bacterium]|nr:MFS transporter [Pseudomonadales bacterium]